MLDLDKLRKHLASINKEQFQKEWSEIKAMNVGTDMPFNEFLDICNKTNRKYTILNPKWKKNVKLVGFYDTVSYSFHFGFRIRKYSNGKISIRVQYNDKLSKKTLPVRYYAEYIKAFKDSRPEIFK